METRHRGRWDAVKGLKNLSLSRKIDKLTVRIFFFYPEQNKIIFFSATAALGLTTSTALSVPGFPRTANQRRSAGGRGRSRPWGVKLKCPQLFARPSAAQGSAPGGQARPPSRGPAAGAPRLQPTGPGGQDRPPQGFRRCRPATRPGPAPGVQLQEPVSAAGGGGQSQCPLGWAWPPGVWSTPICTSL